MTGDTIGSKENLSTNSTTVAAAAYHDWDDDSDVQTQHRTRVGLRAPIILHSVETSSTPFY